MFCMGDGTTDLAHLHFVILIYLFFYPSGNKVYQLAAFQFQLPLILVQQILKFIATLRKMTSLIKVIQVK